MGLLDMIGLGPKLPRLQKKAMEKFGPPENRQGAIEELGALRTEQAVDALLMRYTIRVDPGITDDEEKARVLALIVQTGETALPRPSPRHCALPKPTVPFTAAEVTPAPAHWVGSAWKASTPWAWSPA